MWDNYGIGKINGEGSDNMEIEEGFFKKKLFFEVLFINIFIEVWNFWFLGEGLKFLGLVNMVL